MEFIIPLEKNRDRCISCIYLCYHGGEHESDYRTLSDTERWQILDGKWSFTNYQHVKCYKSLITSLDLTNRIMLNPSCPNKRDWRPYREGMTAEVAFELEQHSEGIRIAKESQRIAKKGIFWSQLAFWAVIISIVLGIVYFVVSNLLPK